MAVLLILALLLIWFLWAHSRPLNDQEVETLANKRRDHYIARRYSFHNSEYTVDSTFKSAMPAAGAFLRFDDPMHIFPCIAAALLKYKKHEWVLLAFEREGRVEDVWINKGVDGTQVCCLLDEGSLHGIIQSKAYSSVMRFHNHPNPDPGTFNCTQASQQDHNSANYYAQLLSQIGVGYVDFVCERGRHYEFYRHIPVSFAPWYRFVPAIESFNGRRKLANLSLHMERLFSWNQIAHLPSSEEEVEALSMSQVASPQLAASSIVNATEETHGTRSNSMTINGYAQYNFGVSENELALDGFEGPIEDHSYSGIGVKIHAYRKSKSEHFQTADMSADGDFQLSFLEGELAGIQLLFAYDEFTDHCDCALFARGLRDLLIQKYGRMIITLDSFNLKDSYEHKGVFIMCDDRRNEIHVLYSEGECSIFYHSRLAIDTNKRYEQHERSVSLNKL